jgi:hypothetical protein
MELNSDESRGKGTLFAINSTRRCRETSIEVLFPNQTWPPLRSSFGKHLFHLGRRELSLVSSMTIWEEHSRPSKDLAHLLLVHEVPELLVNFLAVDGGDELIENWNELVKPVMKTKFIQEHSLSFESAPVAKSTQKSDSVNTTVHISGQILLTHSLRSHHGASETSLIDLILQLTLLRKFFELSLQFSIACISTMHLHECLSSIELLIKLVNIG